MQQRFDNVFSSLVARLTAWRRRCARILRHRQLNRRDIPRMLGSGALQRLHRRITDSERQHQGEIRLSIEAGLPWRYLHHDVPARTRAITLFGKLGVWDTEHNNGVLIYLLLADHAIEIVADRGLSQHIRPEQWRDLTQRMSEQFRQGAFEAGLNLALDQVTAWLSEFFPSAPGVTPRNELPNTPDLR